MSGPFDYPPASDSNDDSPHVNPATGNPSLHPQLQHIRQTLQRERELDRAARELAHGQRMSAAHGNPSSQRRPRPSRRPLVPPEITEDRSRSSSANAPVPAPLSYSNYVRNRPNAVPGERFQALRRSREQRRQRERERGHSQGTLPPLSSLANGMPILDARSDDLSDGSDGPRQRQKRRKLDHDYEGGRGFRGFRYGHYGQVVPGRLRMEIVSCDGGEYSEDSSHALHRVENVLKNDKSVYCTKSSKCNLLLRHQGETIFNLERVVIKAPGSGFTAPVQEGMIFVSMNAQELLKGTSQYRIQYDDSESPSPPPSASPGRGLFDFLQLTRDRNLRSRNPEREVESTARTRTFTRPRNVYRRMWESLEPDDSGPSTNNEPCDWPFVQPSHHGRWPAAAAATSSTHPSTRPPTFTVTTTSDAETTSDEEEPSAAVMADRLRRDSRWRANSDEEDEDLANMNIFLNSHYEARFGTPPGYLRASRRSTPSLIIPKPTGAAAGAGLGDADAGADDEGRGEGEGGARLLKPHARFFIEKSKSRIAVKFDPPVCGKFVLIKLWSPIRNGNIDIQSVAAHGFAGPRFFPACELR